MLAPVLVQGPSGWPVSLQEAKTHLRVDTSDDDVLIQTLIEAATAHLDGFSGTLGRAIMPQTWAQEYADLRGDLVLPFGPVKSIVTLEHGGGTFDGFRLLKDGRGPFLRLNDGEIWPVGNGSGVVTFIAGYDEVPAPIKVAILLHVGTLFENRETMVGNVKPSLAYEALLAPYRVWYG